MKIFIAGTIGLLLGLLAHHVFLHTTETARHWEVVRKYNTYMRDPSNYKLDSESGLLDTDPPADPQPSLSALVVAGELNHVDFVFPTVPYASESLYRYWREFCSTNKGIVYAFGNPSYVAFEPQGAQPLHLNIWFKDSAVNDIQKLIRDIDRKWGNSGVNYEKRESWDQTDSSQ